MTEFEKKQPNSVFIEAGRKAANMLIDVSNNPYHDQPYRTLWDKGWRLGLRFTAGYIPRPKVTTRVPFKRPAPTKFAHKRPQTNSGPVSVDRLVSKLNNRYQTAR